MSLRCCYPNKTCTNPRALRRNGQLHSFCETHRKKANEAQQRWYKKKKRTAADKEGTARRRRTRSPCSVGETRLSDWDLAILIELQDLLTRLSTDGDGAGTSSSSSAPPEGIELLSEQELGRALGFDYKSMQNDAPYP